MTDYQYDVAVSFAGEDRPFVEEVVSELKLRGLSVFYDKDEVAKLWGKNLIDFLGETYGDKAAVCVMFISRHYIAKDFTTLERAHAQARAMRDPCEYILPVRIDDTPVPGMPSSIAYLDSATYSAAAIADHVATKLGRGGMRPGARASERTAAPMPRRHVTLTDRERDGYLRDAFELIAGYFEQACGQLQREVRGLEADLERIDKKTFVVKAYADGRLVTTARIWRGGLTRSNDSICYGPGDDAFGSGGSMNDWLDVELVEGEPKLVSHFSDVFGGGPTGPMTTSQAAEYLWRRFCRPLETGHSATSR